MIGLDLENDQEQLICEEQSKKRKKSGFMQPPYTYEEATNTLSRTTAFHSLVVMGSSTTWPLLQHCRHSF